MSSIFSSIASAITSLASSDGELVLDGSNATDPSQDGEASNLETGPRYLYYRIYTKGGAVASNNPIYSNDQSLSRIFTKSVAPPHTVESLKKHLCKIEGFDKPDPDSCCLFASPSNQKAKDEAPVSLFRPSGLGLSEHDPVALVVDSHRGLVTVRPKNFPERPETGNTKYVYYRLYSPEGEIPSKMAFSESDNSMGRIGTLAVAPPHTTASLKACLNKLERMASPPEASQLFAVINSGAPMKGDDPLQLLTGTYPGGDGDNPMAFVVDAAFYRRVKSKHAFDFSAFQPSGLSVVQGEILTTNGIAISRKYRANQVCQGYDVINSSGKRGFVPAGYVDFC